MTAQEYQRKQALLRAYEALLKNPAYLEFRSKIEQEFKNCIAGLRNRKITAAERQEYQEGADIGERLLEYPGERIAALRKETQITQAELEALKGEFEPEDEG